MLVLDPCYISAYIRVLHISIYLRREYKPCQIVFATTMWRTTSCLLNNSHFQQTPRPFSAKMAAIGQHTVYTTDQLAKLRELMKDNGLGAFVPSEDQRTTFKILLSFRGLMVLLVSSGLH